VSEDKDKENDNESPRSTTYPSTLTPDTVHMPASLVKCSCVAGRNISRSESQDTDILELQHCLLVEQQANNISLCHQEATDHHYGKILAVLQTLAGNL
jgi:hypothetical protein